MDTLILNRPADDGDADFGLAFTSLGVSLTPLSGAGRDWMADNLGDTVFMGETAIIERPYFFDIGEAARRTV